MRYLSMVLTLIFFLINTVNAAATMRMPQFTNNKVTVWETIIYPNRQQQLKMHSMSMIE